MIITCKHCNEKIPPVFFNCPKCGAEIDLSYKKKPKNWYRLIVLFLTIFVIIGTILLLIERQDILTLYLRSRDDGLSAIVNRRNRSNDELIGNIYKEVRMSQWRHDDGSIIDYEAYDKNGNLMKIYREGETGETVGFVILAPMAKKILVSENDAHRIALELASKAPFIDFSSLSLIQKELKHNPVVLNNPEAGSYYSFIWKALHHSSGAELLQTIKIKVNAETGKIIYFSSHDLGTVTISTTPSVNESSAKTTATNTAKKYINIAGIHSTRLFVHKEASNIQFLLWEIVVEELDRSPTAKAVWVYIDALTGEVRDVQH